MEDGQFKIGAIIQARLGSERLPNKVLMPIGSEGRTILSQVVSQLKRVRLIDKIVVATSVSKRNDELEAYVQQMNIDCFRGDEDDVLSRFAKVISISDFDYVCRFTADNPILDIKYLEKFIKNALEKQLDYSNTINLPLGCNFELVKANVLVEAHEKSTKKYDREHVTPYVKRNSSKQEVFVFPKKDHFDKMRLTVDYPSDYSFVFLISNLLKGKELNLENVESLINDNEWLLSINETNFQKKDYKDLEEEIHCILPMLKAWEMTRLEKKLKGDGN